MKFANKLQLRFVDNVAQSFHRIGTLIKHYGIYWIMNRIVIAAKLDGDNIFFVAYIKGDENVRS